MWLSKTEGNHNYKSIQRANRYLTYMETRLINLHNEGEINKVVTIWSMLLKQSKSYQLCTFNRTRRDWYWKISQKDAVNSLKKFMNACRNWDMKLTLERFYLTKPDQIRIPTDHIFTEGEKFRPIGSPTYESRMISKSLNDLIYFVLHKELSSFQHAYRMSRGAHTALIEVWMRIIVLKHTKIEEFDFEGFFNNVKIEWVIAFINKRSRKLACWIDSLYNQIHYKFDREIKNLPKEKEIKVTEAIFEGFKPLIERNGLPQGLSISPILATSIMAYLPKLEGLVMYADDGLIMRDPKDKGEDIKEWFNMAWKLGIYREESKSGPVKNNFKFLGVNFDLEKQEVEFKGSTYSWKGKDINSFDTAQEIYQWFKLVGQVYGKKPEPWTWKIHPDSMIRKFGFTFVKPNLRIGKGENYMEKFKEIINKLLDKDSYKGYKWFIGRGIYHISSSSTKSCLELLRLQKDLRLVKVKSFSWWGPPKTQRYKSKGKYVEECINSRVSYYTETEFDYADDQKYWKEVLKSKMDNYKMIEGDTYIKIRKIQTNKYNLRGRKMR